jgi:hypothetical protein
VREPSTTAAAVARPKSLLWGGNTREVGGVQKHLRAAGFEPVIRAPGGSTMRMICARRPITHPLS